MPAQSTTRPGELDLLIAGIYIIRNKYDGAVYIGSSLNIYYRWNIHHRDLVQEKHTNKPLQEAWRREGAAAFTWLIVERDIPADGLARAEQRCLDRYRQNLDQRIYNSRHAITRHKAHSENKSPILTHCPARLTNKALVRHIHTGPYAAPKRVAPHAKLTDDDVRAILASPEPSVAVGKRYGVNHVTISHIRRGKTWQHIPRDPAAPIRTWESWRAENRRLDKQQVGLTLTVECRRLLSMLVTERGESPSEVIEALIRTATVHR